VPEAGTYGVKRKIAPLTTATAARLAAAPRRGVRDRTSRLELIRDKR
jgi:hypothetical protein